jgi:hypothetical protein
MSQKAKFSHYDFMIYGDSGTLINFPIHEIQHPIFSIFSLKSKKIVNTCLRSKDISCSVINYVWCSFTTRIFLAYFNSNRTWHKSDYSFCTFFNVFLVFSNFLFHNYKFKAKNKNQYSKMHYFDVCRVLKMRIKFIVVKIV